MSFSSIKVKLQQTDRPPPKSEDWSSLTHTQAQMCFFLDLPCIANIYLDVRQYKISDMHACIYNESSSYLCLVRSFSSQGFNLCLILKFTSSYIYSCSLSHIYLSQLGTPELSILDHNEQGPGHKIDLWVEKLIRYMQIRVSPYICMLACGPNAVSFIFTVNPEHVVRLIGRN